MNSSKGELLSGISRLTQGMEALENGASQLQTGVGSYTAGSAKLGEGIAKTAGTNIGMSTTGVAGPDGGTEENQLDLFILVYI